MKDKRVFCEECRNDVNFCLDEVQMEGTIKGEKYSYLGKKAHCVDCGSEIYVVDVNDYNLRALYDMFRERNGIVSLETILTIPDKYAIGKRPISLLLGWGEQTFSRYCDGDMPTKQYSDILQKIHDDPHYYSDILESNKENLKSTTAYTKSKKAVDNIIGTVISEKSKLNLASGYLLSRCEDITPLALQKALYYIQGFHYAFCRTYLFNEDCEAWIHGPVYRDIYYKYRDYCFDKIERNTIFDCSVFTSSEKMIMDSVIKNVCCYSGKVLEAFTHSESPWLSTRGELTQDTGSDRVIEKELIGSYFEAVKDKYNMINPNDIKCYTQYMFELI